MKNLVFLLFGMIMLSLSSNAQHTEFYSNPSIYEIDGYLRSNHITPDFFTKWENGTVNDENEKWVQSVLETQFVAFTINGWLYALSYAPNTENSRNDEDYKSTITRKVWLYKKNVRTSGDWELADYNPLFNHAIIGGLYADGISFRSVKWDDESYNNVLIKSSAFNGVVFILCDINIICNGSINPIKLMITLSPVKRDDGSLHFITSIDFDSRLYPLKFTGTTNGGKTLLTINHKGKEAKINTYMGRDSEGNEISNERVSYDGDYGLRICSK